LYNTEYETTKEAHGFYRIKHERSRYDNNISTLRLSGGLIPLVHKGILTKEKTFTYLIIDLFPICERMLN